MHVYHEDEKKFLKTRNKQIEGIHPFSIGQICQVGEMPKNIRPEKNSDTELL